MKRKILWGGLIFIVLIYLFSLGFTNDKSSYTRISMYELDSMRDIPYLFIGASHTYRGIDPDIIEEVSKEKAFNIASSSQRPEDSYYLLKYILERHKVDTVIYDVWYSSFQDYDNDSTIRTYILLDYMDFGLTKLEYASSVLKNAGYAVTPLSNIARYKAAWKDTHAVLSNLRMHLLDKNYLSYDYNNAIHPTEWYAGNGFVYSTEKYQEGDYAQIPWDPNSLYPGQVDYLKKIIKLCEDYDSRLILITIPVYNTYIQKEPRYEEIYDFFSDISEESDISYFDFNLIPLSDMELVKSDFKDEVHLNGNGAEKFSRYLGKLLAEIN